MLKRFLKDESGPTATEYGILLAVIVFACFTVITSLGVTVGDMMNYISDTIL